MLLEHAILFFMYHFDREQCLLFRIVSSYIRHPRCQFHYISDQIVFKNYIIFKQFDLRRKEELARILFQSFQFFLESGIIFTKLINVAYKYQFVFRKFKSQDFVKNFVMEFEALDVLLGLHISCWIS